MPIDIAGIRSTIQTKVAGVTGISGVAPVYDYHRHVTNEAEILAILKGSNQQRAHWWGVTPAREAPIEIVQRMGCQDAIYRWEIHGYYALQDAAASEKAFHVVVQALLEALRTDTKFGGTLREYELPTWKENDHRQVGTSGILVHHAMVSVGVKKEL